MAKLLHDGLAKMGLELYCPNPSDRLPTVTTIKIPDGFPWAKVNGYLMEKYALEIAGGLGPSAGKVIQTRPKFSAQKRSHGHPRVTLPIPQNILLRFFQGLENRNNGLQRY